MAKPKTPKPTDTETPTPETPVTETATNAPASTPGVETVTAADLNAAVTMPEPNERAIAAIKADETETATGETPAPSQPSAPTISRPTETASGVDNAGDEFNPEIHFPRKTRHGYWAKKGGRPSNETRATGGDKPKPAAPRSVIGGLDTGTAPAAIGDRFDMAAELYTRAGYSVLDGVFAANGEWLPESDGEHIALRGAVATYLRHKGTDDLPPGLAVSLALATYGAKRISKPNTATRVRLYFSWLRAKWDSWRTGRKIDALPAVGIQPPEQSALPPQVKLPGEQNSSAVNPHAST